MNNLPRCFLPILALGLFQGACVSLPEVPEEPLLGIDTQYTKNKISSSVAAPEGVPVPIKRSSPKIPPEYRNLGVTVNYTIHFLIDEQGVPTSVTISGGGKNPGLDEVLLKSFSEWRFRPAKKDGVPVKALLNIPFTFVARLGG